MNRIAMFLKKKRRESQLTQHELSQSTGVGLATIRKLEQGHCNVTINKLNELLVFFGYEAGVSAINRSEQM